MFAVLCVPAFALQAILRVEPALAGKPLALLVPGRRGQVIEECNELAIAEGVSPGYSAPRAQARCPGIILRPRQPDLESDARDTLLAAAFGITAYVESTAPGICTLGLEQLAAARHLPALQHTLAQLAGLGLPASAGLATTPLLALYAARHAPPGQVLPGDRAFLAPLPVAAAEPSPELAPVLASWGIHTLGQLTALAKADVAQRLGREGLALWERAAGETTRPLDVTCPAQEFTARFDCEHELETLEPLLFILRRSVDRLALELANAHQAALAIDLALDLADDAQYRQSLRLPEPVTSADILFRALQAHLETVRTTAGITGVRLRLEAGRITVRQQGLFDGGLRDPHGFADTLARVTALVGAGRAGRPVPADTHQPDVFSLVAPPPTLQPLSAGFSLPPCGLPLRRHRPPTPARVALAEARPAYVSAAGVEGNVTTAIGPWLGSGHWWEAGRCWHQEEWDVELAGGGLYRLAHLPRQGWFVEGEYD
ncbi:MAG TPA: DNA polymerase Y family protein [Lacunisphaera sp.]|nr:DNA polymerase Y family protein [Lacunisphaera sp.]